jgi:basic membrane lipoprotein Med (substrate-binding protein (PBP1-ABC) superfamily)
MEGSKRTVRLGIAVAVAVTLAIASVPAAGGASAPRGNNKGTIGYVVAGDRNDGGFYQGQVESVTKTAKKLGYKVIVVDKVNPGAAQETFQNLCRQAPDLIIGGGSELTDGFVPVSESPDCQDIDFVLVAGFPPTGDSYSTIGANENEAHYMGGVAAGLILQQNGGNTACVVGGPDLPFVRSMEANMKAGLASVAPDKEMIVTLTGDFEDAALATEALQAQIDRGCVLFYPYLGGALPAANDLATQAGIGVISKCPRARRRVSSVPRRELRGCEAIRRRCSTSAGRTGSGPPGDA